MMAVNMANRQRWSKHAQIEQWLAASRLDTFFATPRNVQPDQADKVALLQRYRQAVKPAMESLHRLLATLE